MRNGRKIANHARMNIRLTSKVSAGKQNFCPAEAFLLTLKQILPDSQKSANYPYRVKEMQNLSAVTKTGQEIIALLFPLSNPSITLIWQATFQTESSPSHPPVRVFALGCDGFCACDEIRFQFFTI